MNYKDYYKTLGVSKTATPAEIKKVFRKLAVKYHPDKNQGNKAAEEKFKEANEANEILSNPEKRKQYDELGANWKNQQQSANSYQSQRAYGAQQNASQFSGDQGDFSDFFEHIFSQGRKGRSSTAFKGQDLHGEILLTFDEAYFGTSRIIQLESQKIKINTKPGSRNGQVLKIKGKGTKGVNNGPNGDLFVQLNVQETDPFQRKENDLIIQLTVDYLTAILGGKTVVKTVKGSINLTIPVGTQPNQTLRIKGKGMPIYNKKGSYGDLLVKVHIQLPTKLNKEEKELLEKLKELNKKDTETK